MKYHFVHLFTNTKEETTKIIPQTLKHASMLYVVCVCTCVREMHYIKAPHPVEYTTKTCLAIH